MHAVVGVIIPDSEPLMPSKYCSIDPYLLRFGIVLFPSKSFRTFLPAEDLVLIP